jgi:hypothetical protein
MKDIIRELSLKALKRFANGGDGQADLLNEIEDLKRTLEIRTKEHEEHRGTRSLAFSLRRNQIRSRIPNELRKK